MTAVKISMDDLDLEGRIGLHSKPDAENFYRNTLKLREFTREVTEDGEWVYFEGGPQEAGRILSRTGQAGGS